VGWTPVALADAVLGLAVVVIEGTRQAAGSIGFVVRPLVAVPVALGRRLREQRWVGDVVERGEGERRQAARRAHALAQRVTPRLVDSVLELVDLNDVVRKHVDLDVVVADVDVDAIVARADLQAVIDRVDVDAVVARADLDAVLDRVDVDDVVARVDLQKVIDRIDVDAIVARADLQAVIDRVDVDAVVARADLQAVIDRVDVDAVVARADLQAVIDRVDVDAVVARADLDAVIAKLDLIALAEYVVEGIDLPGIIRSSTGSMASEGLREVRRQGIGADERVAHVVDRLLRRPERAPGSTFQNGSGEAPTRHEDGSEPESGDRGLVR
jgi:hypothetical protein